MFKTRCQDRCGVVGGLYSYKAVEYCIMFCFGVAMKHAIAEQRMEEKKGLVFEAYDSWLWAGGNSLEEKRFICMKSSLHSQDVGT